MIDITSYVLPQELYERFVDTMDAIEQDIRRKTGAPPIVSGMAACEVGVRCIRIVHESITKEWDRITGEADDPKDIH